jgi:hypothetical protein
MLKRFESFGPNYNGLENGDRVVIKYKDAKHFLQTGTITYVDKFGPLNGDCRVQMDSGEYVTFYYTHLQKIIDVICTPSGEVVYLPYDNAEKLAYANIIKYNKSKKMFYCEDEDKWNIEGWGI